MKENEPMSEQMKEMTRIALWMAGWYSENETDPVFYNDDGKTISFATWEDANRYSLNR